MTACAYSIVSHFLRQPTETCIVRSKKHIAVYKAHGVNVKNTPPDRLADLSEPERENLLVLPQSMVPRGVLGAGPACGRNPFSPHGHPNQFRNQFCGRRFPHGVSVWQGGRNPNWREHIWQLGATARSGSARWGTGSIFARCACPSPKKSGTRASSHTSRSNRRSKTSFMMKIVH